MTAEHDMGVVGVEADRSRLNPNEERSQRELATTEVSPRVARVMSLAFVALLAAVPLAQAAMELRSQGWVQALDVFTRRPTREALHGYEQALESRSAVKEAVQPRLQQVLTAAVRVGNDRVVIGHDGWLFYQPGLDYVGGPGFLDDALLRVRATRMLDRDRLAAAQPDPRPALRALREDVARAGARLVLVPVPDKAAVEGRRLIGGSGGVGDQPGNPDWPRFAADMRASGVDVFDVPLPAGGGPAFLAQDTHWAPRYMQEVARALAQSVAAYLPAPAGAALHTEPATVTRLGDLVDMLRLPPDQRLFAAQATEIARVVSATGTRWTPRGDADVLLVGDSFTNIYSNAAMGWGDSAGFAEHLSLALDRPLDVLAENGGAAAAVRLSLARPENRGRLAGKRLVIYQFAMRDLVGQHWPVVRLPHAAAPAATPAPPADSSELEIEGTIVQLSRVPDPATAPYASSIGMTRIQVDRVLGGAFDGRELVAGLMVMRDRMLLPAARYTRGDRVRLRLVPFSRAGRAVRSLQRSDDIEAFDLPVFWTLEEARP
jgi:alginate O-acetyltransferase complex protein AlgJ